jgi:hypothetical protein
VPFLSYQVGIEDLWAVMPGDSFFDGLDTKADLHGDR